MLQSTLLIKPSDLFCKHVRLKCPSPPCATPCSRCFARLLFLLFQCRDAISRAFSLSVGCACVLLSHTMARPERLDLSTSLLFLTLHKERLKPSTAINYSIDAFLMGGTGLTTMQQQGHLIWLRSQWMKVNALMPQERAVWNHRWRPQAEEHTKALCGSKQGQCCGL